MDVNLIMFREDGSKRIFPLEPGANTIGRKDECNIRIPLATVSRRHAKVSVEDSRVTLSDLGAANGTLLNKRRIEEEELQPGDQVTVGPIVFTVQIDGNPANDDLVEVRSKVPASSHAVKPGGGVVTSKHVYTSDDDIDPIAALEALASSADQTAIDHEENE
jgi:pSer/pThr/pTyr-binding forkhead associated (FHA) protein